MAKSLEELRREKETLLRKANARDSLRRLSMQRTMERKKLKAEIKSLKHPKSIVAKKVAKRIGIKSGKLLGRGVLAFGRTLGRIAEAEEREEEMERRRAKARIKKPKRRIKKRKGR